ncbi:MAG: hypothetical protein ABIJ91_02765 [Candidatus Kuenenbacteria bacterium]
MYKIKDRWRIECKNLTLPELEELHKKKIVWVLGNFGKKKYIKNVLVINYHPYNLSNEAWVKIRYDLKNRCGFFGDEKYCWQGFWDTRKQNWTTWDQIKKP